MALIERVTRETNIRLELQRGSGQSTITTGIPFLDHMMVTLARYASLDTTLGATGDLKHHTIEDVAIAFGTALAQVTPATAARYGNRVIPMDDALVQVAVDLGGRPF
jgi:imidazoleglycerol-phosphate dehydratase